MNTSISTANRVVILNGQYEANEICNEKFSKEKIKYDIDLFWYLGWGLILLIALFVIKPWKKSINDQFGFNKEYISTQIANAPYQDFKKAAGYIENKDYYNAKLIVAKEYAKNSDDVKLAYFYSLALFGDNKTATVSEILTPIASGNSAYKYKAAFLLALNCLKENSPSLAKQWLLQIPRDAANYSQAKAAYNTIEETTNSYNQNLIASKI